MADLGLFDPQRFVGPIERYFGPTLGRIVITAMLALFCLAATLLMLSLIWDYGGKATFDFFASLLSVGINVDNIAAAMATLVWYVVAFGVVVVAILYFLSRALFKRVVPQSILDELARLRNFGIEKLYAASPNDAETFRAWTATYEKWNADLLAFVQKNFPQADYLRIKTIGVIQPWVFQHAYRDDPMHGELVLHLAHRLKIIEELLASYRR